MYMLEIEFKYFLDNKKELISKYADKFIVIVGETVVANFDTESEAYTTSVKKYGLGNFLIQLCSDNESKQIQTFHSRLSFA